MLSDKANYVQSEYASLITKTIIPQIDVVVSTGKPYYVGLPAVGFRSGSYTSRTTDYNRLKTYFILPIWNEISKNATRKKLFKGFYFTDERIYGTTSASSPTSNPQIALLNDLAYTIRNDPNANIKKEFIWSPYLGRNSSYYEITNNIGMVGNRTNIFSTIFLQSNYYFSPDASYGVFSQSLDLAIKSATGNKVLNFASQGNFNVNAATVVGGSKTSSTKIALNMEAEDNLNYQQSTYGPYSRTQCEKMKTPLMANACPFIFYGGSHNGLFDARVYKSIDAFYTDGTCELP